MIIELNSKMWIIILIVQNNIKLINSYQRYDHYSHSSI